MNCLLHTYSALLFSRTGNFVARSCLQVCKTSSWNRSLLKYSICVKATNLVGPSLLRFHIQCYSTRKSRKKASETQKLDPNPKSAMMKDDEKDAFFVVRKGETIGIYKSLSDCQAQVGSSICDPPVSVYKGYSLPREAEEYLAARGLKNAIYSIRATDLKEDLFGLLTPCPFQQPLSAMCETSASDLVKKRSKEVLGSETAPYLADPERKHAKLDDCVGVQATSLGGQSCILEFDGASKGNPGKAGAGAVLRADNGSVICRLREGLGTATNNVAEYRAMILGLKYALNMGFTRIHVKGDSKLVCLQLQGLWKVKNQNISDLYEEAKKLKDKFLSFDIGHVLREFNSEADAQANLAVQLADGQVHEELEK